MKSLEQIQKKIDNEKEALEGLKKSADSKNPWLDKQIAIIENRVKELEWVVENDADNNITDLLQNNKTQNNTADDFLARFEFFQKDEFGIYSYISQNQKHLINLKAILEAYEKFLK